MQIYLKEIKDDALPSNEMHDRLKIALPDKKYRSILKRQMSFYAYDLLLYALNKSYNINDAMIGFENKGKPYLENYPDIHISIAHSGNYAVCAIDTMTCGIDIEQHRTVNSRIFRKTLSPTEIEWVNHDKDEQSQSKRFLKLWTMKEALLKSTGEGITVDLRKISLINENRLIEAYNSNKFVSFDTDSYILTAYGSSNEIDIHNLS